MIAIIDYGMGNLRSVQKGFEKVGFEAIITQDRKTLRDAEGLILPGVGAFGDAMKNLRAAGLDLAIKEAVAAGKPLLGICLGMQLLLSASQENGWHEGLGIIPGTVRRLPAGVKVPHMGWNQVEIARETPLLEGVPSGAFFYFVHSYYVDPEDKSFLITTTDYGLRFPSIFGRGNVFGIQFHPEKSSKLGLQILKNYGELVMRCC